MKKELSILFSSYGEYQDLLPVTYHFFNKYWKECKYDVYWGSNGKKIDNFESIAPKWKYIHTSNNDLGWSKNLKDYLENIDTPYVLLLLDDFLILKKPKIELIEDGFDLMKKNNAVYLRLNDKPKADKKISNIFGTINYYSDYRSSLQPAIWKKDILLNLCDYNFNPWLFEWRAGIVQETIDDVFLGVFEDIIFTQHCIEKGMWIENVLGIIEKEGIKVSNRKVWKLTNTKQETFLIKDKIISLIPKQVLFHLRKIMKKGIFADDFQGYSHK